jgi:predicted Fe-Mo cluster-binding NifX family protein
MKHNPNIVFSKGIGQKAINLFKEKGIEIKTGNFSNLKELIENIKNLQNIKNGNLK